MKKVFKVFIVVFLLFLLCVVGLVACFIIITSDVKLDDDKLINLNQTVTYYDVNMEVFAEEVNGINITEIDKIPSHTINAFISIEDKRFYSHKGVDYKGLIRALFNNVKSLSIKEGASTISQQLIKNTHLSSEKTLKRKLSELKLASILEKKYTKNEILEKYLNTIYFGENCYGITNASRRYFNKKPQELTLNESAMLAGVIKAPSNYSPFVNLEKCIKRKNLVLNEMLKQGFITKSDYDLNVKQKIQFNDGFVGDGIFTYLNMARKELNSKIDEKKLYGKNLRVYTSFDPNAQQIIYDSLFQNNNFNKACVLLNNDGSVKAYCSTCGNAYRQMGSVFKPIMVYAPAIENDVVYSATKILDKKTDFNGYSPKNFNDKYYGHISVKDSFSKSLNVCAVKLLSYTGVNNALNYVKKTDIPIDSLDNSLSLALGATSKGATLTQIASSYTVFNNLGNFYSANFINKITDCNGNELFKHVKMPKKIFHADTISIVNDMMRDCVLNGTAKKLSYLDFPIYAKTGTVGFENGNSDAYTLSFNSENILAVWYGAKDNGLMVNTLTGGNLPCSTSAKIWAKLYDDKNVPNEITPVDVETEYIDKISYEIDNEVVIADSYAPERYKIKTLFKKNNKPNKHSFRFYSPTIDSFKISVKNNEIFMRLCVVEYVDFYIYRDDGTKKELVYNSKNKSKTNFHDANVLPNKTYRYSIVPYYEFGGNLFLGKEIFLDEIKIEKSNINNWWKDGLE